MKYLFATLLLCALAPAAFATANVHREQLDIPQELRAPLAALVRMSTGLEADKVCAQMALPEKQVFTANMTKAVSTLYQRLQQADISAAKSERILRRLMDEGEKMAQFNYPTCTKAAPDIIVKAIQDAECINPYLAGSDTTCFR